VESVVLVVVVLCLAYVCFWSVENDEIFAERKKKERFRLDGGPEEPSGDS
jgi:hypothetical protein